MLAAALRSQSQPEFGRSDVRYRQPEHTTNSVLPAAATEPESAGSLTGARAAANGPRLLASQFSPPRLVKDAPALLMALCGIKLVSCPHCGRCGALIGHGFLRGYAERGAEQEVRGRRFFCSNRALRPGCGRTFSALVMTVLRGFMVRTLTLLVFAVAVLSGLTRRAAWLGQAGGAFSLSSGYRLWRRLQEAQSGLRARARLCREAPAPRCASREPLSQLLAHFAVVPGAGGGADLFAAFQARTQRGLFDSTLG